MSPQEISYTYVSKLEGTFQQKIGACLKVSTCKQISNANI